MQAPHIWGLATPDPGLIGRRKRKRRGSERTHNGSDPSQKEHNASARDGEEGEFDLAAPFMEPSEGWWTSYGFKSLGEYLRYSETGPDRPASLSPPRKKKNIRAPELPTGGVLPRPRGSSARTRQISIRLDEEGYQALVKAARMYGVAPATMGRLLVAKGARKAVESG
jgi:hypothetical protein